jgi:hypothetical protein
LMFVIVIVNVIVVIGREETTRQKEGINQSGLIFFVIVHHPGTDFSNKENRLIYCKYFKCVFPSARSKALVQKAMIPYRTGLADTTCIAFYSDSISIGFKRSASASNPSL